MDNFTLGLTVLCAISIAVNIKLLFMNSHKIEAEYCLFKYREAKQEIKKLKEDIKISRERVFPESYKRKIK